MPDLTAGAWTFYDEHGLVISEHGCTVAENVRTRDGTLIAAAQDLLTACKVAVHLSGGLLEAIKTGYGDKTLEYLRLIHETAGRAIEKADPGFVNGTEAADVTP